MFKKMGEKNMSFSNKNFVPVVSRFQTYKMIKIENNKEKIVIYDLEDVNNGLMKSADVKESDVAGYVHPNANIKDYSSVYIMKNICGDKQDVEIKKKILYYYLFDDIFISNSIPVKTESSYSRFEILDL